MTTPLTSAGYAVAATSLALVATGLLATAPVLTAVGAAGATALVLAWLVVGVRPRLEVQRATTETAVDLATSVHIRVEVRNTSRWLPAAGRLSDSVHGRGRVDHMPVPSPVVPPRTTRCVEYTVPTNRRGLIRLGPIRLTSADPLGLLRRSTEVGEPAEVVVHPRVHLGALDLGGAARSVEGVERDGIPNGAVAFHSLRDYVPGDDPRTIHWRSSARRGELVVRQHVDVVLPRLTVVIDTRAGSYPATGDAERPDFEAAIEVAASLVATAPEQRVSLRLVTTGGAALPVSDPVELPSAMDLLARLDADAGLGFVEVQAGLEVRPGSSLLVLSGYGAGLLDGQAPATDTAAITALARRHDRCLAVILGDDPDRAAAGESSLGSCRLISCVDAPTALRVISAWGAR